ncbi:MAG: T9SS type A sorting domain-containing protein, partial [Bacteroidia bacterium]|nr:T9SS type A sorting domain-containing protein [Bacteroidia bacterium]
ADTTYQSNDFFIAKLSNVSGIDELPCGSDNITVYPNPNTGRFVIAITGNAEPYSLEISDFLGSTLYRQDNLTNNSLQINISDLSKGIYFVKLNVNGRLFNKKVVLQ